MAPIRSRPARDADERTALMGWYDLQRGIVVMKADGLSDEAAHRSVIPTSPLMTVAGPVAHLRWAEELWFREVLLGEPGVGRGYGDEREDAEFLVDDVPIATLLDEYRDECARTDATLAARSLDDTGSTALHEAGEATVRWMVLHMLEETARHAGHLDLIREIVDGDTGYY